MWLTGEERNESQGWARRLIQSPASMVLTLWEASEIMWADIAKTQISGPYRQIAVPVALGWGPRTAFLAKFPGAGATAGLRTILTATVSGRPGQGECRDAAKGQRGRYQRWSWRVPQILLDEKKSGDRDKGAIP